MNVQATYENNRLTKLEAELSSFDSNGRRWPKLVEAIVHANPNQLLSGSGMVRYDASGVYYTEIFGAGTDMYNKNFTFKLQEEFAARAEEQQKIITAIMDAYAMHEQFHKIQEQLQKGG